MDRLQHIREALAEAVPKAARDGTTIVFNGPISITVYGGGPAVAVGGRVPGHVERRRALLADLPPFDANRRGKETMKEWTGGPMAARIAGLLAVMACVGLASPGPAAAAGKAQQQPHVPVESGATLGDGVDPVLIDASVMLVRIHGWKCDTVSALLPFTASPGYTLRCNDRRYSYELRDRGGTWVAELK